MIVEGSDLALVLMAVESKVFSLRVGGTPGSARRLVKFEDLRNRIADAVLAERALSETLDVTQPVSGASVQVSRTTHDNTTQITNM